jgi:hypothetical protein
MARTAKTYRVLVARAALDLVIAAHATRGGNSIQDGNCSLSANRRHILLFKAWPKLTGVQANTKASIGQDRSNDGADQTRAVRLAGAVAARNHVVTAGIAGFLGALGRGASIKDGGGGGQDGEGENGEEGLHVEGWGMGLESEGVVVGCCSWK